MIYSASLRKPLGHHRCYACDATVSANKLLCRKHVEFGESAVQLIVPPNVMSDVGKVFLYRCTECAGETPIVVRDPGLLPMIWKCHASERCAGGMIMAGRIVPSPGENRNPEFEFYRPRGRDYSEQSAEQRELLDMGILDWRRIAEQFVQSPPANFRAVPRL